MLDGNGATTRAQLNYPSRVRGVIKIGSSTVPFADGTTVMPQWLVIENLEISGAHAPEHLHRADGAPARPTPRPRPSIYVEFGENITVRNCDLHHNGNGFFAFSSDTLASRNILRRGQLHPRQRERRAATSSTTSTWSRSAITFQYNHLGATCSPARAATT